MKLANKNKLGLKQLVIITIFLVFATTSAFSQLSGTYTIGPDAEDHYTTIKSAAEDVDTSGVSGPVIFMIDAGTYSDQFSIKINEGFENPTSSENTITFQSATGVADDVIISRAGLSDSTNFLVRVDSAQHISFVGLTFDVSENAGHARALDLTGYATNITIEKCILIGSAEANVEEGATIYIGEDHNDSLYVKNNIFIDGAYGIYLNSWHSDEVEVINNTFESQQTYGVYFASGRQVVFNNNTLNSDEAFSLAFFLSCTNVEVAYNKMRNTKNSGLRITYGSGGNVYNNMIFAHDQAIGIGVEGGMIYHNTLLSDGDGNGGTLYLGSNAVVRTMKIKNNIVMNLGAGLALEVQKVEDVEEMDYNLFYSTGDTLVHWDRNVLDVKYATLTDFSSATGSDINSVSKLAELVDTNTINLHLTGGSIGDVDLAGTPIESVLLDFDGEARDLAKPYMGADENVSLAVSNERFESEITADYHLSPAYPNPFNPQTTFGLTITQTQKVTIEVYNVLGQKVSTLHRGEIQSGQQANFTFDAINLTSGLYFIRVAGERFTVNHKVILLK